MPNLHGDLLKEGSRIAHLTAIRDAGSVRGHRSWIFRCDCGKELVLRREGVLRGNNKSCGCRSKELRSQAHRRPHSAQNQVWRAYRNSAQQRALVFAISKETFFEMTQRSCYYCGSAPEAISWPHRAGTPWRYNGIDRVDSERGYEEGNMVTCCRTCNMMKQRLSYADFLGHVWKLFKNLLMTRKFLKVRPLSE